MLATAPKNISVGTMFVITEVGKYELKILPGVLSRKTMPIINANPNAIKPKLIFVFDDITTVKMIAARKIISSNMSFSFLLLVCFYRVTIESFIKDGCSMSW